ncbi:UNVERIFIED_ORG: hypothetical protein J2X79_002009 [Arthrobacter globiformis]|nr:hypothetical protein [Arthrobacter globiformis]
MARTGSTDTLVGAAYSIPLVLGLIGLGIFNAVLLLSPSVTHPIEAVAPGLGLVFALSGLVLVSWRLQNNARLIAKAEVLCEDLMDAAKRLSSTSRFQVDYDRTPKQSFRNRRLQDSIAEEVVELLGSADRQTAVLIKAGMPHTGAHVRRARLILSQAVKDSGVTNVQ